MRFADRVAPIDLNLDVKAVVLQPNAAQIAPFEIEAGEFFGIGQSDFAAVAKRCDQSFSAPILVEGKLCDL